MLLFGEAVDEIGQMAGAGALGESAILMTVIGAITWVAATWQMFFLNSFSQRIAYKIKVRYFAEVIHKDATWFDNNNPLEISSMISR